MKSRKAHFHSQVGASFDGDMDGVGTIWAFLSLEALQAYTAGTELRQGHLHQWTGACFARGGARLQSPEHQIQHRFHVDC